MDTVQHEPDQQSRGNLLPLIVFLIVAEWLVVALLMGNFYIRQSIVEAEILRHDANAVRVVDIDRGIYSWARVSVEMRDGTQTVKCFDTNIFFYHTEVDCKRGLSRDFFDGLLQSSM